MSLQLTPFILFFMLLFVLVISSFFAKSTLSVEGFKEGATDKSERITTSLKSVASPLYSTKHNVYNLYDNIFYDDKNANLIEISTPIDTTGKSKSENTKSESSIFVTERSGTVTLIYTSDINTKQNLDSSLINTVLPQYYSWSYNSQTVPVVNSYSIFYMPWFTNTYMHIIDNISKDNLATFLFSPGNTPQSIYYPKGMNIMLTKTVIDNDIANNTMVSEPIYSTLKEVYQISHYVKYDYKNGNLLIQNGDGSSKTFTIHDINNNITTINANTAPTTANNATSYPNATFKPFIVLDSLGQNLVLYVQNNQSVVIALITLNQGAGGNSSYVLKNVRRFTSTGLETQNSGSNKSNTGSSSANNANAISEYYKWYWYWNTNGIPGQNGASMQNIPPNINDYILKTQIVPPVCPTCPTCPSTGTCTNCGNHGGSGTMGTNGSLIKTPPETYSKNTESDNGEYVNIITSGGFVSNANPNSIAGGLTLTGYDTIAGIEDVAKTGAGVITGVANTGGNVIGGVANTVGGVANNLINTTGSVLNTPGQGNRQGKGNTPNQRSTTYNHPGLGTNNQPNDPYSYYGQLPAKGPANFAPLTSDFSKFGR
jgi:hypothetical protein